MYDFQRRMFGRCSESGLLIPLGFCEERCRNPDKTKCVAVFDDRITCKQYFEERPPKLLRDNFMIEKNKVRK